MLRGDAIVTSPQSTLFPAGLPVGKIATAANQPGNTGVNATITSVREPRRAATRHRVVVVAGHARPGVADNDDHDDIDDDHDDLRRDDHDRPHDDPGRRMRRSARLAVLVVVDRGLQVAVFPHLRLFGVVPDLGLLVALAVGYYEGPEAGAIVGFAAGLGFDLFLETPLGLNALSYAIVGYSIGVFESGLFRSPRWLPSLLGGLGGLAGGLLFIGIGVLVGVDAVKGVQGIVTIAYAALYDALARAFRVLPGQARARVGIPSARRLVDALTAHDRASAGPGKRLSDRIIESPGH